jgi:gliding motility-associated-like protein
VATGSETPCSDEPLTLDAGIPDCSGCVYQWSTGATTPAIEVPPGTVGTFSVRVCNEGGCVALDSIAVATFPPIMIELGADIQVVSGTILTLPNPQPGWTFQWNTGSTAPSIVLTQPGIYAVTVTDQNGCTATDFIEVTLEKKYSVWVPNAFSPNGDGYSDYLPVFTDDPGLKVLTFRIADRWGDLCYRRDDYVPQYDWNGWDGRWRGQLAGAGVYGWYALVKFSDGEILLLEGDVTLIR